MNCFHRSPAIRIGGLSSAATAGDAKRRESRAEKTRAGGLSTPQAWEFPFDLSADRPPPPETATPGVVLYPKATAKGRYQRVPRSWDPRFFRKKNRESQNGGLRHTCYRKSIHFNDPRSTCRQLRPKLFSSQGSARLTKLAQPAGRLAPGTTLRAVRRRRKVLGNVLPNVLNLCQPAPPESLGRLLRFSRLGRLRRLQLGQGLFHALPEIAYESGVGRLELYFTARTLGI